MKPQTLLLALLSAATFTMGCKKAETPSQQLDKVQAKTAEAVQDMKDYTFAQKAEFVERMQLELADINKELDQLAAKIEKANAATKAEAEPKLKILREQMTKLNQQLDEARNATDSGWNDIKTGFKKGVNELKEGFQNARQWVSDKIAP